MPDQDQAESSFDAYIRLAREALERLEREEQAQRGKVSRQRTQRLAAETGPDDQPA
ncbi:hypothetical protein [Nonomuraea sp. NPDC049646]|uniref:hypothetical protein n=1 Tax=unclassified Nonomuraea TaxID=2593643 RepID=UPI00379CC4DB